MACPFFMPTERVEGGAWQHPARLPLGSGWSGTCTATGHDGQVPPQNTLERFCNLGYAVGCAWVPQERDRDAVRFAIAAPLSAAQRSKCKDGSPDRILRLRYVCERDHRPVAHGTLEFDFQADGWSVRHEDARIQKMAECFLESYLRKKSGPRMADMKDEETAQ